MVYFFLPFFILSSPTVLSSCCTNCQSISTSCTSCSPSYYLYNSLICLSQCPEGYSTLTNTCSLTSSPIFVNEDFSTYNSWTVTSIGKFSSITGVILSDSSKSTLIVTKFQGLYATTTSVLKSMYHWVAAPDFTLMIWVLIKADGHIFEAVLVKATQIRLRSVSSAYEFIFTPLAQTGGRVVNTVSLFGSTGGWEMVSVKINQSSATVISLVGELNGNVMSTKSFSGQEASYVSSLDWTLGCINSFSFSGFIYKLLLANEVYSGSLQGPLNGITCDYDQYYQSNSCISCSASCSNAWPWCVSSSSCSPCYNSNCYQCTGFSSTDCLCQSGEVYPNCCFLGCSICSAFWVCTACEVGYNMINSICLDYCPTGDCSGLSSTIIIDIKFIDFLGNYNGFVCGSNENTFQFFNNPENDDPIPVIGRGLYFNSNQYLSNSGLMLAYAFTVGVWVFGTSGNVYSKGSVLSFSYNGQAIVTLLDKSSTASNSQSLTTPVTSWTYLTLSISFSPNATSISCTQNTQSYFSSTISNQIFKDSSSSFIIGNSFTGFIYSIQIWNYLITDFSFQYSDNICGTAQIASCLNTCPLNQYFYVSCASCAASCTDGCVNGITCNVCQDQMCVKCGSFVADCLQCTAGASGTPCSCGFGFYQLSNSCQSCNLRCSACTGSHFYECSVCQTGFSLWESSYCLKLCPSGYSSLCVFETNIALALVLNTLEIGKTGTTIFGSNSQNVYPQFDSADPVPTKQSGYYFFSTAYMSLQAVLAPNFSLNFWVRIDSAGVFLSKSSVLSLTLGTTCVMIINFSFSSSYTFSFVSVLQSWQYISILLSASTLQVYSNMQVLTTQGLSDVFDDSSSSLFIIGNDFTGFLYSFHILNTATIFQFFYSKSCPSSSACLSNCNFGQDSQNNCSICPTSCTKGCFNTQCILCSSDLCTNCTTFNSCSTCLTNSTLVSSNCVCNSLLFYNQTTLRCEPCQDFCNLCNAIECFQCQIGYYIDGPSCIKCPLTCTSCNPICTSCIPNATLSNTTCNCTPGHNGPTCQPSSFSASLSLYGSSQLLLYFTEPLSFSLSLSDISITIDSNSSDFSISKESNSKFFINLTIIPTSKDQILVLNFLSELISTNNSLLDEKQCSIVIGKANLSSDAEVIAAAKVFYSQAATYTAVAVAAVSGIGQNPASFWSFINTVQLLCFVLLSGVNTTPEIEGVLEGLRSYYLFPNGLEYFYQDDSGQPYAKAKALGFSTGSFYMNIGKELTAFVFFLVFYFLVYLLSKCKFCWKFLNEIIKETVLEFKYGFFIRFSIQNYLEVCISCLITIFTHSTSGIGSFVNLLVACIFSVSIIKVLLIAMPIISLAIAERNRRIELKVDKDEFKSLYGTLFYEFNSDENLSTSHYYTFFFVRRLIYSVVLFALLDYPVLQMVLSLILSLAVIFTQNMFYLFESKPFSEPILNYSNLLSEVGIGIFFTVYSFLLFDITDKTRNNIDQVLRYTLNAIMIVQMSASVAIFIKTIYKKVKEKKKVAVAVEHDRDLLFNSVVNMSEKSHIENGCEDPSKDVPKEKEMVFMKKVRHDETTILSPKHMKP